MARTIAVISPKKPQAFAALKKNSPSHISWFSEIEAGFAFLLTNMIDKIIIDQELVENPNACTLKYKRSLSQLHPRAEIEFHDLGENNPDVEGKLVFYPTLETLFRNGELNTLFQPIIRASGDSQEIYGIECLSRLNFNGCQVPPEFIFNYATEKLKLTNYDRICLMQALTLAPKNSSQKLFVNVRPQTLIGLDFVPWLRKELKKNQIVPEQIIIEVTEQNCILSEQEIAEQCIELKRLGFSLAADDFGSGVSNLSMIEIMKPDYLKISGRFINNCDQDSVKKKIVRNILDLANDFNISAVVENVETESQWQTVKKMGARLAQGFHFYKPLLKTDLSQLF